MYHKPTQTFEQRFPIQTFMSLPNKEWGSGFPAVSFVLSWCSSRQSQLTLDETLLLLYMKSPSIACNAWASCSAICCSWRKLYLVEVKIISHFTSKDKCCHGCKLYTLGLNMQGCSEPIYLLNPGEDSSPTCNHKWWNVPTHVGLALLFVPWKHRSELCSPNDFLKERTRGL